MDQAMTVIQSYLGPSSSHDGPHVVLPRSRLKDKLFNHPLLFKDLKLMEYVLYEVLLIVNV